MEIWRYRYHGLTVRSEIRLEEWSVFEDRSDTASGHDVAIRRVDPGIEIESPESDYRFCAKHAGEFVVRGGREILFAPVSGTPESRLRLFLVGWAWGALMYQRRAVVLHASAVQVGSGAVAFCARRGSGKSTIAAVLSTLGYPLVSDDFCCIRIPDGRPPRIYPSVPRFKLCEDVAKELNWNLKDTQSTHAGKYHYLTVPEALIDIPLKRIYLLGWGDPELHRLRGFHALTRLTAAGTWRGDVLLATGDPAGQFNHYTDLVRQVECWELRRTRDFRHLAEHTARLTEHMSDLTL